MQRRIALTILACSVAVFFAALYDAFGAASLALGILGFGGIAVGSAGLLFSLRTSALHRPNVITLALVVLGIALHAYEQTLLSSSFSFGWLLWALVPYAICLAASIVPATRIPSIVGATIVLLFDLWAHHGIFVAPSGSTAALALIFIPLWSSLVFAPLAMFIAWLIRFLIGVKP